MSAPDTNIEKQKHRHRRMIHGIWLGVAIAFLVAAGVVLSITLFGTAPTDVIPEADGLSG